MCSANPSQFSPKLYQRSILLPLINKVNAPKKDKGLLMSTYRSPSKKNGQRNNAANKILKYSDRNKL